MPHDRSVLYTLVKVWVLVVFLSRGVGTYLSSWFSHNAGTASRREKVDMLMVGLAVLVSQCGTLVVH